jgi:hypothetical protein
MRSGDLSLFKTAIENYARCLFEIGQIDSKVCARITSWLRTSDARGYAQKLFRYGLIDITAQQLRLQLKYLLETDGRKFRHIEVIFIRDADRPRRKCFVGHRFSQSVAKTLRWNLRQVLEPYNVELDWSGRDVRSVQILPDIVSRIKASDFCVFDNRDAKAKPNVYIEVGMCIALEKPLILFEHEPSSGYSPPIPSDLGHALALRYNNYKQLFEDFYPRLPLFFEKNMR